MKKMLKCANHFNRNKEPKKSTFETIREIFQMEQSCFSLIHFKEMYETEKGIKNAGHGTGKERNRAFYHWFAPK
jgi:hypothetical protein